MKEIQGYKAFNKDRTNRYGMPFEEGKIYNVLCSPVFGNNGVGFHFCERLEDTLRYFPGMEEEIAIARVTSLGDIVERNDEYYGYYDMYSTNKIRIDHFLSREEILKMFLNNPRGQNEFRVARFLEGFRLTKAEIEMFRFAYHSVDRIQNTIEYYQEGKKNAFEEGYQKQLKGK